MRKTLLIFLVSFMIMTVGETIHQTSAYCVWPNGMQCVEDEDVYVDYAFMGQFYEYKVVTIRIPHNIEWYEYLAMTWQLDENRYEFKLIFLNTLLIKKGLEPIYY